MNVEKGGLLTTLKTKNYVQRRLSCTQKVTVKANGV